MTLEAGSQVGRYVVRQKLTEGGMAEIYLCAAQGPEGFEKEVVIKRVRSFLASDPGFVQMFIAEARVASRLNHANVVQIFDFDKHEDTYYLAMEYVRGCSLWELRRRCKERMEPIPPVLVAHIGAEVARGLHYAHRLRVDGEPLHLVHRDVTPQNILISFDGAVKLTDFGIAKAGKSFTAPGMLKGKFAYMSPEQARGEDVDARTDIFALGVVLWELLTGGRLFDGDSEVAVLRAVQQSVIAPPARLNPEVPPELDAVVRKALERDPEARYQSAFELERALAECALRHSQSVEDTDVGAFTRMVFGIGFTTLVPVVREGERIVSMGAQEATAAPPSQPTAAPRRSTAVLGSGSRPRPVQEESSPDEDVDAATHVVLRPGPSPRTEPMPSVRPSARTPARPMPEPDSMVAPAPQPAPARRPSRSSSSVPMPAAPTLKVPSVEVPAVASPPAPSAAPPPRRGWALGVGAVALLALAGVVGTVGLLRPGSAPPEVSQQVRPEAPGELSGRGGEVDPVPAPPVAEAPDAGLEAPPDAGVGTSHLAGAADAGTGTPPDAGSTPAPPEAVAEARGRLLVRAIPFATVLLNGKRLGEVQGKGTFMVPPGSYRLTFSHPAGDKVYSITVLSNETVSYEFRAPRPR